MIPVTNWLIILVVVVSVFGVTSYFIVQGAKANRLLKEEKARSERLLRRLRADLDQAAKIQRELLPAADPRVEGYDISGLNIPCYEVGGDYYDFITIDDDRVGLVIADVAGKGTGASLLMASLRAALMAEVRPVCDLGRMASHLSDFILRSSDPSRFITFFYGELDRKTGGMRYVNAGHNPPFILRNGGATESLPSSGFALGMFPGAAYDTGEVRLEPGDLAVLFTDGIPDGRNDQGKDYSEDRLREVVRGSRREPAREICRRVIEDLNGFACGSQPCDDITLVIVKRD